MIRSPAIALLELASVAVGTQTADAMIKRAPIDMLRMGTVQPGKYLILVGGSVAAVEEAHIEGLRVSGDSLLTQMLLPNVHEQVYESVGGTRRNNDGDALGIIETCSLPANVFAADKAVKSADVTIVEIRLGDGLGGKGITQLTGLLTDVEAAMEAGIRAIETMDPAFRTMIIPVQHAGIAERVGHSSRFSDGASERKAPDKSPKTGEGRA
jgi:microcompartment protein CcmL/EutN